MLTVVGTVSFSLLCRAAVVVVVRPLAAMMVAAATAARVVAVAVPRSVTVGSRGSRKSSVVVVMVVNCIIFSFRSVFIGRLAGWAGRNCWTVGEVIGEIMMLPIVCLLWMLRRGLLRQSSSSRIGGSRIVLLMVIVGPLLLLLSTTGSSWSTSGSQSWLSLMRCKCHGSCRWICWSHGPVGWRIDRQVRRTVGSGGLSRAWICCCRHSIRSSGNGSLSGIASTDTDIATISGCQLMLLLGMVSCIRHSVLIVLNHGRCHIWRAGSLSIGSLDVLSGRSETDIVSDCIKVNCQWTTYRLGVGDWVVWSPWVPAANALLDVVATVGGVVEGVVLSTGNAR